MQERTLPSIPAMGVGSYAGPGWYIAMRRRMRAGELGPHDAEELVEDATRIVIDDQRAAGVDVFTDGELSRQRFVYEVFDRLEGLERGTPRRKLGIGGYDVTPGFRAEGAITAPAGLGIVEEYERLARLVPDAPKKIALPGPFTFAGSIEGVGVSRERIIENLIELLRVEIAALVSAGADYIQLDEPGLTRLSEAELASEGAEIINRTLAGLEARCCVHVCFGNNAGRPMADRRITRLADALSGLGCQELMLEFANRGMIELELAGELAARFDISAGVIDVKNFWLEPPEEVARRIECCLAHVPEGRLRATADCGFSALPRYIAFQKLSNLVAGTKLVRGRL